MNTTAQVAKKMSLTVKGNAALPTIRVSALEDGMTVKYNHHKSVGVYTVLLVAKNEDNRNYTLILTPIFRALGDLWESGPTGTNVNDVAVALVYE